VIPERNYTPPAPELAPTPTTLNFGLRFRRGDALVLRLLEDRVRSGELGDAGAQLYADAAAATERGEALHVVCVVPEEIHAMAEGFVVVGCQRPEIEDWNRR
jgi:hypothetical protein